MQMRNLIDLLWAEWKTVEDEIEGLSRELELISAGDAGCTRIRRIPGIGPIVATAIVAAIGNGAAFRGHRDYDDVFRGSGVERIQSVTDRRPNPDPVVRFQGAKNQERDTPVPLRPAQDTR